MHVLYFFVLLRLVVAEHNIIVSALQLRGENKYGNRKTNLFSFISLDNKLRYCKHYRTGFAIFFADQKNRVTSPRLVKLSALFQLLYDKNSFHNLVYLDIDTVFLHPRAKLFDHNVFNVSNSILSVGLTCDIGMDSDRFQTGVILLRNSKRSTKFIKDWFILSMQLNLVPVNKDACRYSLRNIESDQWLLQELIRRKPRYKKIIGTLVPKYKYNAFPVLGNNHLDVFSHSSSSTPLLYSTYWDTLRLPPGDEIEEESDIAHFAGVFGGASIESGLFDSIVALLAVQAYTMRHMSFNKRLVVLENEEQTTANPSSSDFVSDVGKIDVDFMLRMNDSQPSAAGSNSHQTTTSTSQISGHHQGNNGDVNRVMKQYKKKRTKNACSIIPHAEALVILNEIVNHTTQCIETVFSDYLLDRAEATAQSCLQYIMDQSSQRLLTSTTKEILLHTTFHAETLLQTNSYFGDRNSSNDYITGSLRWCYF